MVHTSHVAEAADQFAFHGERPTSPPSVVSAAGSLGSDQAGIVRVTTVRLLLNAGLASVCPSGVGVLADANADQSASPSA